MIPNLSYVLEYWQQFLKLDVQFIKVEWNWIFDMKDLFPKSLF
jgi:hypothetical protein